MTDTADDLVGRLAQLQQKIADCPACFKALHPLAALVTLDDAIARLDQAADRISADQARIQVLEAALAFYADPQTYIAIGFFPDRPCGEFVDDFSDDHGDDLAPGFRPGKLARQALSQSPTTGKE